MQVPEGIDWAKLNAYVMEKYRRVASATHVHACTWQSW